MKDYSQGGEQHHIMNAFSDSAKPRRFLDIGAWNATELSNTRALYEMGWSGVLIEPSPVPMSGLIDAYGSDPRITLIQAAVAPIAGELLFMQISDDALSTSSMEEYCKWKDHAKFRGGMRVPTINFQQLGQWYGGFDLVSIDVEGPSVDLFHAMIAADWRPRCVCVEYNDRMPELCSAATAAEYKLVSSNGTNAIFVR